MGAIPYQSAPNLTDFSTAGIAGQLLVSGGSGAPTWTSSPSVTNLQSSGTLTHSGNVGIGITPTNRLHVNGDLRTQGNFFLASTTGQRIYPYYVSATNHNYVGSESDGALSFGTGIGAVVERMRIDNIGNVGINTNFPSNRLTVAGSDNQVSVTTGTNELVVRANSSEAALYTFQAIPLNFYTNNTERVRIGTTGAIGLSGANYGTSGQALVSNGSDAAPSWQTISSGLTAASTAEAQAYASDSVALTPLKMKQAMQGSNASFAANGYQKLPSGLIIQWGSRSCAQNTTSAVTFPIVFPNAVQSLSVVGEWVGGTAAFGTSARTTTGFNIYLANATVALPAYWIAIGY